MIMKKLILCIAAFLTISIIGCKSGGGDPKTVLISFFEALGKKDISTAKKYATKDSEAMLGMMEMGMKMAPAGSEKDKAFDKGNMEFGDSKIEGDKATVPVKDKKSGETTNYTLKKEGGDWKVAFDKATMTQMGTDKMKGMNNGNNSNGMSSDSLNKMGEDLNKMTDSLGSMMNKMKTDTVH